MTLVAIGVLLAAFSGLAVLGDATVPEVTGTVGTAGQLGIGAYLLFHVVRLATRVITWLEEDSKHKTWTRQHNKKVGRKLSELVTVLRRAHGIPDSVVVDLTPMPEDPDEVSPGRRRGVEPG